jgi:hypothetical protein
MFCESSPKHLLPILVGMHLFLACIMEDKLNFPFFPLIMFLNLPTEFHGNYHPPGGDNSKTFYTCSEELKNYKYL